MMPLRVDSVVLVVEVDLREEFGVAPVLVLGEVHEVAGHLDESAGVGGVDVEHLVAVDLEVQVVLGFRGPLGDERCGHQQPVLEEAHGVGEFTAREAHLQLPAQRHALALPDGHARELLVPLDAQLEGSHLQHLHLPAPHQQHALAQPLLARTQRPVLLQLLRYHRAEGRDLAGVAGQDELADLEVGEGGLDELDVGLQGSAGALFELSGRDLASVDGDVGKAVQTHKGHLAL